MHSFSFHCGIVFHEYSFEVSGGSADRFRPKSFSLKLGTSTVSFAADSPDLDACSGCPANKLSECLRTGSQSLNQGEPECVPAIEHLNLRFLKRLLK